MSSAKSAGRRPAREWDAPGVRPPEPTRLGEVTWLEPFPDTLLDGALDGPLGRATLGLRPAALVLILPGEADPGLFHRVPSR